MICIYANICKFTFDTYKERDIKREIGMVNVVVHVYTVYTTAKRNPNIIKK